jgi:hypothetical protein
MAGARAARWLESSSASRHSGSKRITKKLALDLIEFVARATGLPRCGFDPATNGK